MDEEENREPPDQLHTVHESPASVVSFCQEAGRIVAPQKIGYNLGMRHITILTIRKPTVTNFLQWIKLIIAKHLVKYVKIRVGCCSKMFVVKVKAVGIERKKIEREEAKF